KYICVSNEDVATISTTNVATGKVEHIVPVTQEPEGVAFTPDGKTVFATCETNGDVVAIDFASSKVRGRFTVPPRPRTMAISPDGKRLYVANGPSNDVSAIDLETNREVARIAAGEGPWGIATVAAQPVTAP